MVQTMHFLYCDGEQKCPHRKVPYRSDFGFCVTPPNLQVHLAVQDGWSRGKGGDVYCPICTGNRKLYQQMKLPLLSMALLCLLDGCETPKRTIAFESIPPGAIVHYNKAFVGQTPCTLEIETNGDGTFKGGKIPFLSDRFTAEPATNAPGLYPQEIGFRRNGILVPGEKVPGKIFFDLRKPSATPATNPTVGGSGQRSTNQNAP